MTPFELSEPASLDEAIAMMDPDDPDVRAIAGGTAVMLMMKAGVFRPRRLVSLRKLGDRFTYITVTGSGVLKIGAMTPLSVIEHSAEVAGHAPVMVRVMARLSNVRVRNVATLGGALAHGDPHMDLPPVLIALGASVLITGPSGERTLTVEDLLTGYYETALARNELITEVHVPAQAARRAVYFKVTAGSADDWPSLGVAAAIGVEKSRIVSGRIVVCAATAKAGRLKAAEQMLVDADPDDRLFSRAADAAAEEVDIIADARGSASYKRELLRVYTARAISAAVNASRGPV